MSSISILSTFASTALYNRFAQSPPIQKIAVGVGCLSQGKRLLCNPDPSPDSSSLRQLGRKITGITLIAGGLAEIYWGITPLIMSSTNDLKKAFLTEQTPISSTQESRYERLFKAQVKTVEKPIKVLYLGVDTDADHNGVFNPGPSFSVPRRLESITDLKYKTIRHPFQICQEIQSASKTGPVQELVIGAHGFIQGIMFSPTSQFKTFDKLPQNCFDGLASTARIFLDSCSTGQHSLWKPNVAEWLSLISGREVIAPSDRTNLQEEIENCSINPDGRLDIRLQDCIMFECTDHTTHFNTSTSWSEKALFSAKMVAPTIFGAMVVWQTMRLGATILQGSGIAGEWLVDRSAAPIKQLAERTGFYNPDAAETLYTTTKNASQFLNEAGKAAHEGMDMLIQPVSRLGSFILKKSFTATVSAAETLYNKIRRS